MERLAISFHHHTTTMTLIGILVLLFPFYVHQLASSQSQVPPNGQQQSEGDGQASNNLQAAVSNIGRLEEDGGIIATGQNA